jgi:hypothetical protein
LLFSHFITSSIHESINYACLLQNLDRP